MSLYRSDSFKQLLDLCRSELLCPWVELYTVLVISMQILLCSSLEMVFYLLNLIIKVLTYIVLLDVTPPAHFSDILQKYQPMTEGERTKMKTSPLLVESTCANVERLQHCHEACQKCQKSEVGSGEPGIYQRIL